MAMMAASKPWEKFLQSSAISYVSPTDTTAFKPSNSSTVPQPTVNYYWHPDLLQTWSAIYYCKDAVNNNVQDNTSAGSSNINYGSYMLLASSLAETLSRRLALVASSSTTSDVPHQHQAENNCNEAETTLRIGIAIPEGPFLPLFILVVHSLNVAVAENWLCLANQYYDGGISCSGRRCDGVVLIPMETDEAPERLKHMLSDSSPSIILVAPGKDMENVERQIDSTVTELVDYTDLVQEASSSLSTTCMQQHKAGLSLANQFWPTEIRDDSIDTIRYPHGIVGCYDVARLIAIGCIKLVDASFTPTEAFSANHTLPSTRGIMSHIVYTSGTTGKPKGCVSSLASLQHYIRAKNIAHDIDNTSRVLLASAITFDPCLSDILASSVANAVLCVAPRDLLYSRYDDGSESDGGYTGLTKLLRQLAVTHVLCTPTLWSTVEGTPPGNVPSLKVIALGGEQIPKAMVARWARPRKVKQQKDEPDKQVVLCREYPRLYATYGVTEACVYQTCGEVVSDGNQVNKRGPGQSVGLPLLGTNVHIICTPTPDDEGLDAIARLEYVQQDANSSEPSIGEVVLSGAQVDAMSSYLNLPELTAQVFVQGCDDGQDSATHFYRTGDLGYVNCRTGELHLLGRIKGDGMVKLNGIRIELAEVENSVIDDASITISTDESLVIDCMATVNTNSSPDSENVEQSNNQLVAYCILSDISISELGISSDQLKTGAIVPRGPLLTLLRTRCDRRVRKGCTPSFLVLIDRLPLSPTGKRNRAALPPLSECSIMGSPTNDTEKSLWNYGKMGRVVASMICECLNLQPCQRPLITIACNFFDLGGDSLAATRVVRGVYAQHHGVLNARTLGGATGTLAGPFAAKYLLQSNTLGGYVDFLESQLDLQPDETHSNSASNNINDEREKDEKVTNEPTANPVYDSLIESITLGYFTIASALLDEGADPNSKPSQGRLGKVTDRNQQRSLFKSNPLHLACLRGNPSLVQKLLNKGCKANTPDATGSFPIHLACSRLDDKIGDDVQDCNRKDCVRLLLECSKTPISIKDGNKQTILHSAARSGHCQLLKYILVQWRIAAETTGMKFKSHNNIPGRIYDWQDRWFRTPVHWAVLNGKTAALKVLLDNGCSAFPPTPKQGISKRTTNIIIETPVGICLRLYGETEGIGKDISYLLREARY